MNMPRKCPCNKDFVVEGQSRCRACNAAYFRDYRQLTSQRMMRKGAEQFRRLLIQVFEERNPDLMLNGRSAADIVREVRMER